MVRTKEDTQPATPSARALKVGDRCLVAFGEDRSIGPVSFPKDAAYEGEVQAELGDSWLVVIAGTEVTVPRAWVSVLKP